MYAFLANLAWNRTLYYFTATTVVGMHLICADRFAAMLFA